MNRASFNQMLRDLQAHPPRGFTVAKGGSFYATDDGPHPVDWINLECAYAAGEIAKCRPQHILDVGSYRHFLLGLSVAYKVTMLDIRPPARQIDGENSVVGDVRNLTELGFMFDMVLSLCAMEHVGLGRYGDAFDIDGDRKAFAEVAKALPPGGHFVFTIPINKDKSRIEFNAHRVYSYAMIESLRNGLIVDNERFYRITTLERIERDQVTSGDWDLFCGHWRKVP